MSAWHIGPMAGFDLETTSVDVETARIVTASLLLRGGSDDSFHFTRSWLVNPGVEIPAEAAKIHGITNEKAQADGRDAASAVWEIAGEVGALIGRGVPLVIYNAPYDLTVFDREMRRHMRVGFASIGETFDFDQVFIVDPLVLDKQLDKYRKGSRKLTAVSAHYGVDLTDAHTSDADALAAMRVAYKIAVKYPQIAAMAVPGLVALQRKARAEQAASLYRYLRAKGSTEVVDDSWPIRKFTGRLQ